MATHRLDATPATVRWGMFDASFPPVLTVASGDTVEMEGVNAGMPEILPQAGSGFGAGASATVFGARGASNFLSKSTKWLAIVFVVLSIVLAALAVAETSVDDVSTTLDRNVTAPGGGADLLGPSDGTADDPLAEPGDAPATGTDAPATDDPLAE